MSAGQQREGETTGWGFLVLCHIERSLGVRFTLHFSTNQVIFFLTAKRRNSRNITNIHGLRSFLLLFFFAARTFLRLVLLRFLNVHRERDGEKESKMWRERKSEMERKRYGEKEILRYGEKKIEIWREIWREWNMERKREIWRYALLLLCQVAQIIFFFSRAPHLQVEDPHDWEGKVPCLF